MESIKKLSNYYNFQWKKPVPEQFKQCQFLVTLI